MLSDSQGCSKRITVKDWGISKIAHAKSEACGRPAAVHAALSVLFTWSSVPWARSALNACGPSQTHRWFCWNLDGFSIRLIDALLSLRWRFIEDWLMLHWWFRSPLIFFVVLDVCWWCLYDPSTFYWRPDCTLIEGVQMSEVQNTGILPWSLWVPARNRTSKRFGLASNGVPRLQVFEWKIQSPKLSEAVWNGALRARSNRSLQILENTKMKGVENSSQSVWVWYIQYSTYMSEIIGGYHITF